MTILWSMIGFVIAISVLVAFHEFGHFWAARRCGVKIERFSIGFGKVLFSRKDKHGTEFAVSLIPLGGYVKMLNEDPSEPLKEEDKPFAFSQKTVLQRAFIVSAGPIANFLLAIILYASVFMLGIPTIKPVIESVQSDTPAAIAQLPAFAQITQIDGEEVQDWQTINMIFATKMGKEVALTLLPKESKTPINRNLDLTHWRYDSETEMPTEALGIKPVGIKVLPQVAKVEEGSAAWRAGIRENDELFQPNGEKLVWEDFVQAVRAGRPVALKVLRQDQFFDMTLVPEQKSGRFMVGLAPKIEEILPEFKGELKYGVLTAFLKGAEKTVQLSLLTFKVIGKLFTGELSAANLSGPLSIAKGAGVMVQIGLVYYLSFLALISVNLGVMNLLPLPVLDGGHLFFLACEKIKGKSLSETTQQFAYKIGSVLLLSLTAFALINDFLRL